MQRRALPAFAELGLRVKAIWGRRRKQAVAVAARYGAHGTTDFADLLGSVDAVYIATPVVAHVPLAIAALEAGRHVLVEKPLGGDLAYDRARLAAAAAGPAVSAVAYYRRLAPAMVVLRGLVSGSARQRPGVSGPGQVSSCGGPYQVIASFRTAFDPAPEDPMYWRTVPAVSGGGVLADAGSHRLDLLCWLLGPPARVGGALGDRFPGGAERVARLELAWPDGSTARLRCAWADGPGRDCLACIGTDQGFALPRLDSGRLTGWVGDSMVARDDLAPRGNVLVPVLRDFMDCIGSGRAPACPLADAVLVDDLIRSISEGKAWPTKGSGSRR